MGRRYQKYAKTSDAMGASLLKSGYRTLLVGALSTNNYGFSPDFFFRQGAMIKWQIVAVWVTLHHMQVDMHIFLHSPIIKAYLLFEFHHHQSPLLQNHFEQDAILHGIRC